MSHSDHAGSRPGHGSAGATRRRWLAVAWLAAALVSYGVLLAQAPPPAGKEHPELPDTNAETCDTCHEGLAKAAVVHAPVAAGACTDCHEFSGSGDATRVAFAQGATRDDQAALCGTCHDFVASDAKAAFRHAPAAIGSCITCHDPHGGPRARLLKTAEPDLCLECHDDIRETLAGASSHAPAQKSCTLCHSPHASSRPAILYADINTLCTACHAGPLPQATTDPQLVGRPVSAELAGLLQATSRIQLDPLMRINHPVSGHPVRGPKDPLIPERAFTCVSCHRPHGSASPRLSRFTVTDASLACLECHK